MNQSPQKNKQYGSIIKLFLFVGLVWASIVAPFSSVIILVHMGATAPQIGIFSALGAGISVLCQPMWGFFSDHTRSPRRILSICLGASAIFFGSVLLTDSLYIAALLMLVDIAFRCSVIPLLDSHTLLEISFIPKLQYGHIRVAGSLFYGLMSLFFSWLINVRGVMSIILVSIFLAAIAVFWGLFVAKGKGEKENLEREHKEKADLKKDALSLLKNKGYILFVLYVSFSFLAGAPLINFAIEYVNVIGGTAADVPMMFFLRCMVEIVIFIIISSLSNRLSTKYILTIGMGFTLVYVTGLLFTDTMTRFFTFHTIGSVGFTANVIGRMRFLRENAPPSVLSTSITLMASCEVVIGAIIGNLIAGYIIGTFGIQALTIYSLCALFIAIIFLGVLHATVFREKPPEADS